MKKMKLFPKIFLFTFTMMLLISIIAHLLIFLIAPSQNVLVTNMVVTNTGVSALSEVDMPRLITQTMLKTFPISIFCCATISALFSYFFFKRHNHSDIIALKIRKSNVEIGARRKSDCIVKG